MTEILLVLWKTKHDNNDVLQQNSLEIPRGQGWLNSVDSSAGSEPFNEMVHLGRETGISSRTAAFLFPVLKMIPSQNAVGKNILIVGIRTSLWLNQKKLI